MPLGFLTGKVDSCFPVPSCYAIAEGQIDQQQHCLRECLPNAGPVLESLMSMKNLPATAASALQGGSPQGSPRGQPLRRVQEGAEAETSGDEDEGNGDKLSPLPSITSPQRSTQVRHASCMYALNMPLQTGGKRVAI